MGQKYPLRILLAEDNLVNQMAVQAVLERLGYQADTVGDGQEAVDAVLSGRYDVVLMDVQMPRIDGKEATRRIRRGRPAGQQPRIIALTANVMERDRQRYIEAGMDGYVSKPVRVAELIAALTAQDAQEELAEREGGVPGAVSLSPQTTLDPDALRSVRATMGEQTGALVRLFLEHAASLIANLRRAVAEGDAGTIEHAAHTLVSGGRTVGAVAFSALCYEMEQMGQEGCLEGVSAMLAQAEVEYARLRAALEAEIERASARSANPARIGPRPGGARRAGAGILRFGNGPV